VSVIDGYIAQLDTALRGPRRAKRDLLTEARDHLIDATEAYQDNGLGREAAERHAVREFGEPAEIVPGFQTELGLAQGRRTALLVLCVFAAQPFIWGYAHRWVSGTSVEDPRTGYAIADSLVEWLGGLTILASILVVAAYGIGVRYLGARRAIVRATGVFGFVVSAVFGGFGVLLTFVLSPEPGSTLTVVNLLWTVVFMMAPLTWIATSARRCLVMS
jgi:hypothetical protein